MKRIGWVLAVAAAFVAFNAHSAAADTHPAHWTDGTTHDGQKDYGPPPLPAKWTVICDKLAIDPPTYTYITVHDSAGGSRVFPYKSQAPGFEVVDVSDLVGTHAGTLTLTWNIGTGVSAPLNYDCSPAPLPTTTTTSSTVAPTSTTSTTVLAPPISAHLIPPAMATPGGELPRTGSSGVLWVVGGAALVAGLAFVIGTRRGRAL